ncbi:MAG TPA: LytTR family DNA-binding domain-containing protein, partial [Puia sp.]|nr:LytTR family DNA-binding domain-containing protein [Puia sp.]
LAMINYVLVDDEPKNIRILRNMLDEFCPDTQCAGSAANIEEAGELIQKVAPDLVFLDIQLPGGNAFDLLESLLPVRFEIIFVTAFNDYALKAFRYAAIDYLLKPVNIEELKAAVQRAGEQLQYRQLNSRLQNLLAAVRGPSATWHKLALVMGDGLTFIPVSEIVRCEASSGYTVFHMCNGETHMSTRTIREYEDLLPPDLFLRIHNSHIVNLKHVKKYHRGRGGYIELDSQVTIQVSTRRKTEFLSRFGL